MKKINHKKVFKEIENIRKKNNKQWMSLMRIAFDAAPDQSRIVLKQINVNDKKISALIGKLAVKK